MKKKRRSRKFANGRGSVYKLSGKNRTRPFAVAITTGWDNKGHQKQKIIGYVKDFEEGVLFLKDYFNDASYNIDYQKITFKEAFDMWINSIVPDVTMSSDNKANYLSTFNNHCNSLYKIKIADLRTLDVQNCINSCTKGFSTKRYIRLCVSQVYNYCINVLDIKLNRNFASGLKVGTQEKSNMHKPIKKEDIKLLWEHSNEPFIDSILIMIYCGLRPSELLKIKIDNIHLDENYMIGGIKTKAGIDRIIPINKEILHLIKNLINLNETYLIEKNGLPINYNYYKKYIFDPIMKKLELDYKPHDGRHTLATELDNLNANDVCIKLIMGHEIQGVTKGVYTHKSIQQLVDTINLLSFK